MNDTVVIFNDNRREVFENAYFEVGEKNVIIRNLKDEIIAIFNFNNIIGVRMADYV